MVRQKRKYLPFLRLQPPQIYQGFYILSHSLQSSTRCVLEILVTNLPPGIWTANWEQLSGIRLAKL